ncbi:hypothetical protein JCM6882_004500 [Rhodosporidiobolus microsporus]
MGGGPRTPPSVSPLGEIDTRSSEDLVEITHRTSTTSIDSDSPAPPPVPPKPSASSSGTATPAAHDVRTSTNTQGPSPLEMSAGGAGNEGEGELAELLWSKSAVYLCPSSSSRDNLSGFLSIVRVRENGVDGAQEGTEPRWKQLLSWVPESMVEGTSDFDAYVLVELSSQNERDILVHLAPPIESAHTSASSPRSHAFSYPLTSLYALQIQPPTLTNWIGTVTVSLFGGVTLPPLHFHDDESRSTLLDQDRRASSLSVGGAHSLQHGRSGSLAPSWGGEALLNQLRQHARIIRSQLDPSVYLVNPSRLDLDSHVIDSGGSNAFGAWEDDAVPDEAMRGVRGRLGEGERGERAREREEQRKKQQRQRTSILHQSSPVGGSGGKGKAKGQEEYPDDLDAFTPGGSSNGGGMDALTFSVLSGFSRITRGARQISQQAASTVLSHPLAKPLAKHVPKPIAQFALAPGEVSRLADTAGVGTYDSARVYLAKWAKIVAEEGERARKDEYGVDDAGFLEEELGESTGVFEVLQKTYRIDHKPRSTRAPRTPIQLEEWRAWFDPKDGTLLLGEKEARRRIFQRGLADDEVRKEVWPYLLRVYSWNSTAEERRKVAEAKSSEYERVKRCWMQDEELAKTERFQEEDHRVEIDCRRTDRTHPLFANDLPPGADPGGAHPPTNGHVKATHDVLMTWVFAPSYPADGSRPSTPAASPGVAPDDDDPLVRNYVQGMSDLFSPLYVVLDGEQWLAYACFEDVMLRQKDNFRSDQAGMRRQLSGLQSLIRVMDRGLYRHLEETGSLNLFFCFRWILTSFKRELTFDQTVVLWENFFTDYLGHHFHLFFALAILEANRDVMVRYLREFDEILKYTNQLSGALDVQTLLSDAEVLYHTFAAVVSATSPPAGPSSTDEGLRQRKTPAAPKVGTFPPTEEDAEEQRREKVRERTRREVEGLKELLE